MIKMTEKRNEKNWAKVLDDCCKSNAELVEQIADLKAELEDIKKDMSELDDTDKVLFTYRFKKFKKKWGVIE